MSLNWEQLKISQVELEQIFEVNIITSWAIAFGRVLILGQPSYRQSLLKIQGSYLFLSLLFFCPTSLIVWRSLNLLDTSSSGLIIVLLSAIAFSVLGLLCLNYYLWRQAKKLKLIIKLLTKVAHHNRLINDFQLLASLNKITKAVDSPDNSSRIDAKSETELKNAFNLTKSSLLRGMELESLLYHHHQAKNDSGLLPSPHNRYQLLANLEDDLVNLSVPEVDSGWEYQELINEAVSLGLSVHQEMRKIEALRG